MPSQIVLLLVDPVVAFFVSLLLARFHFQWLRVPFRNPVGEFVVATTNWIVAPARRVIPPLARRALATPAPVCRPPTRLFLRPRRRVVPPIGNVDVTPLILLVLVQVLLIPVGHLRAWAGGLGGARSTGATARGSCSRCT